MCTLSDGVVSVLWLKSGEKKSPMLPESGGSTSIAIAIITRLRQKWLDRTSNVKKALIITTTMPI